uniref:Uncharacterized protein n=1 Tax=Mus musculus TaxID=10090 RepID=Q8BQV0_MOUSE|nr:unnamed protein product [Mus musculus]
MVSNMGSNSFNPCLCSFSRSFPFFSHFKYVCGKEHELKNLNSLDSSQLEPSQRIVICMSYESLKLKEIRFPSHKTKQNPDSVGLSCQQCPLFVLLWFHGLPEL